MHIHVYTSQAAVNIDAMSQCMAPCKGEKSCVDSCVSANTSRGLAKDILQCLAGCGLNVSQQSGDTSTKDNIKACLRGCADAMH